MRILPVIDLLDGHVVRAVAGERARYRPVRSRLAVDADPVAVCAALLELAPFAAVYVADLDAITRDGSRRNVDALLRLGAVVRRRGVRELWLDAGRAAWTGELAAHLAALGVELVPVIGSESLAEDERPRDLAAAHTDFALSLDHRAGAFIGPPALARAAHLWPRRVLAMELAGVGMRRRWNYSPRCANAPRPPGAPTWNSMPAAACAMPPTCAASKRPAWPARWSPRRCTMAASTPLRCAPISAGWPPDARAGA